MLNWRLGIILLVFGSMALASPLKRLSGLTSSLVDSAARLCFLGSTFALQRYLRSCAPSRISYFPTSLATVSALTMAASISGNAFSKPKLVLPLKESICDLYDDKH